MKHFIKSLLIFSLLPAIVVGVLSVGYFICDPFNLLDEHDIDPVSKANLNRGYVSTEKFLKDYSTYRYNAFIFGSSRSLAYNPETWKKYIGEEVSPFSFDASSENMMGIYHKLVFLDSKDIDINHAIILVDTDVVYFDVDKVRNDHLLKEHPLTLNNSLSEWFGFHKAHFLAYMSPRFLLSYYGYELFGIDNKHTRLHRAKSTLKIKNPYNWIDASDIDRMLDKNPAYFESDIFHDRPATPAILDRQIGEKQVRILSEIKNILDKRNTCFRIIINPLYDQKRLDNLDIDVLKNIFGAKNVYDFSGKNGFTESKYNYYENSHFRIHVGDSIIKYIYQDSR